MKNLEIQPAPPAAQLAADEACLEICEANPGEEYLIFWEPTVPYVVVGYANKVQTEVNVPVCQAQGVPILRRSSGGGTIVQLPGGLNYSLVLRIDETGPTRNISSANQNIMERNRRAIQNLVPQAEISVRGHTDLCKGPLKFAGNAQRRRKNYLLFHGTLLLNCDLARISELLRMPSLQPDYRENRPHDSFVGNLELPAAAVKAALIAEWGAQTQGVPPPQDLIEKLVREKFGTEAWNYKF